MKSDTLAKEMRAQARTLPLALDNSITPVPDAAFTPAVRAYFNALKVTPPLPHAAMLDQATGPFFFALPTHLREAVLAITGATMAALARRDGMTPEHADAAAERALTSIRQLVQQRERLAERDGGGRPLMDDELDAIVVHVDGLLADPGAMQPPEMSNLISAWIAANQAAKSTGDEPPAIMARAFHGRDRAGWRDGLAIAIAIFAINLEGAGFELFDRRAFIRGIAAQADAIRCGIGQAIGETH